MSTVDPISSPAVRSGAKQISVHPGLTGLVWTEVSTQLSGAAREHLRETFPAVAVEAFTGTTEEYWQDWLSDEKLDQLAGLVVVFDSDGLPVAWVANNDPWYGGRRCF